MSTEEEQYERWLEHVTLEEATLLREQATSIEELHDAFYRELSFGTGRPARYHRGSGPTA